MGSIMGINCCKENRDIIEQALGKDEAKPKLGN